MSSPNGVQVTAEGRQHQRQLQQDRQAGDVEGVLKQVVRYQTVVRGEGELKLHRGDSFRKQEKGTRAVPKEGRE
jgi:hypothetical protein